MSLPKEIRIVKRPAGHWVVQFKRRFLFISFWETWLERPSYQPAAFGTAAEAEAAWNHLSK